jgi:hypothetical protein
MVRYDNPTCLGRQPTDAAAAEDEPVVTSFHPEAAAGIHIAPGGWADLADADTFYPCDLPEDWRLTYFANAVGAVLVPSEQWVDAPPGELVGWRDDVHDRFRFFLNYAGDQAASVAAARAALGVLLEALVGTPVGEDGVRPCLAPDRPDGPAIGYAAAPPDAVRGDLRGARHWLRELERRHGTPPRLVVLARPTSAELSAWQQLVGLLGLAP